MNKSLQKQKLQHLLYGHSWGEVTTERYGHIYHSHTKCKMCGWRVDRYGNTGPLAIEALRYKCEVYKFSDIVTGRPLGSRT